MSISMISKYFGQQLLDEFLKSSEIKGRFVPMICGTLQEDKNYCREVYESDTSFVDQLHFDGTITASDGMKFSFLQAGFGSKLEKRSFTLFQPDDDFDECTIGSDKRDDGFKGKAVLVSRGNCDFGKKAEVLSSKGAGVMLLVNNDDENKETIFTMGIDSELRGFQIRIAAIMISKKAGDHLMNLINAGRDEVLIH